MGAEAVELWHADADLKGVDAVIVPGGFSYGDYLRPGAIARFAKVMAPLEEFADDVAVLAADAGNIICRAVGVTEVAQHDASFVFQPR